jgi:3-dehydrosphinganine reductase
MTTLAGSHVLVTGGSRGIGAAFARIAAASGATVSLIARGEVELRSTAESIGAQTRWRAVDVRDADALAAAVAQVEVEGGPIDILVSCAGAALPGRFLEAPLDEFREQLDLNYLGTVTLLKTVLPGMVDRGHGHVVLTSSVAALMGVVGYTGYGPAKWAVRGLAETLRYEVEPQGIRIAVLYPPDTDTPGFALENTRKPPETAAISAAIKPVSPERVAAALARGIERNRENIAVDALTKVLVRWGSILEPIARGSLKRTIAKALAQD